uniref:Pachytene checkpoint protein 2 C-terminal domain-containing protein n=1 Tax=Ditylenchus dipsaci TaxID=166011 RepID=A0A915CMT4_9BILA
MFLLPIVEINVVSDTPKLCSSLLNKKDAVDQTEEVHYLERLASKCAGMSGRSIRKLPVLAYSKCMADRPSLIQLLVALEVKTTQARKNEVA